MKRKPTPPRPPVPRPPRSQGEDASDPSRPIPPDRGKVTDVEIDEKKGEKRPPPRR